MQRSILTLTLLAGAWTFSATAVSAQTTPPVPTTEVPIRSTNTVSLLSSLSFQLRLARLTSSRAL